jgi:sugar phosphate isomerase/epimerase
MANFRLGAHTYVFTQYGYDQAERLDEIFDIVARTGYPSIELHSPMFDPPDWKARMMAARERTGLEIVGGSSGGQLWDAAKWNDIRAMMDTYSAKLRQLAEAGAGGRSGMKCGFSCSGKHFADRSAAENQQVIDAWTKLGEMCRARGVTLNYHTHGEPIEDIQHVIDNVPADLVPLGPDLDWLRVGGVDPEAFLRTNGPRVVMMHIRDYHVGGDRTEALGEGDVDYARLGRVLDEIGFTGDFVVELAIPAGKEPTRGVEELLRISRAHLAETMGL